MNITYPNEEEAYDFDHLMDSMWKCKRGVMWKPSVAHYVHHQLSETLKLEEQIQDDTYTPRLPKTFEVTHPKRRTIKSTPFRDRVYQRILNDLILYPAMTRTFCKENCACQTGKGTDYARDLLEEYLHRFYRKHGTAGKVLQVDVKGYYEHMVHEITEKQFAKQIPAWASARVNKVLDGQYAGDTGYNPGSQMVQIAGISYISPLDHLIKERLGIKLYVRYMDDLILISDSEEELRHALDVITDGLASVGLWPHPQKTRIYPVTDGITFLGFRFLLSETGKVYRKLTKQNIKNARRHYARMVRLVSHGEMTRTKLMQCYQSWRAHALHGDNFHTIQRMDIYLKERMFEYGCLHS